MAEKEKEPKKIKDVVKAPIHVYTKWCKHCGICIAFCPKGVFTIGKDGEPIVAYPEKCINCGLCAMLCPDFAISGVEGITRASIDLTEFISP